MQLSIVIVNYNVKHFLEQCLYSVEKARVNIESEVIVVDNNSTDNSVEYLRSRFPAVQFVSNKENTGFAKACNQGAKLSRGNYILFLNPDTLVPEDCFITCLQFMDQHNDAGALGVRMLDGKGKFLKESKRSFPSPTTSLYKLFGLAKLFPSSPVFAKYHLGHLDEHKTHEVDVLAGAFFMVRKSVLEKTGGFDETFFMYGEDVDLSYRIQKAGHKNYYVPEAVIIHFKGESTRKGSMNYVRMFYNAMSIFVRKHYGKNKAGFFNFLIHIGIWVRAGMSAVTSFIRHVGLPLIDAALILLSFWLMKSFWNDYVRTDTEYPNKLLWIAFPVFTVVYLITAYYAGLYDRWYKRAGLVRSTLTATIVLLAGYALLPEQYRFSRAIILFGALLAFILISILRWLLIKNGVLNMAKRKNHQATTVIVGSEVEFNEAKELMKKSGLEEKLLGRVAINENDGMAISDYSKLKQLNTLVPYEEIIFCCGILGYNRIIKGLTSVPKNVSIKFHAVGSNSIVGSDSKDSSGVAVSDENGFNLSDPYNRRIKRLLDICISLIGIIGIPIHMFIVKNPIAFLRNCFMVIAGELTWVGYATMGKNLPPLRRGVLACNGVPLSINQQLPAESLQLLDYWYARDYEPVSDLRIIGRMYRRLGS